MHYLKSNLSRLRMACWWQMRQTFIFGLVMDLFIYFYLFLASYFITFVLIFCHTDTYTKRRDQSSGDFYFGWFVVFNHFSRTLVNYYELVKQLWKREHLLLYINSPCNHCWFRVEQFPCHLEVPLSKFCHFFRRWKRTRIPYHWSKPWTNVLFLYHFIWTSNMSC